MDEELSFKNTTFAAITVLYLWLISIATDTIFLTVWLYAEAFVSHLNEVAYIKEHFDSDSFLIFQNIFKYSTLIPVIAFIIEDEVKIITHVIRRIRNSIKNLKK